MATAISSAGTYSIAGECYLANDINVSGGTALTFTQPGVRLNMAGKTIRNTSPHPTNLSMGIRGRSANNFVITDGSITGFRFGINSSTPWTRIEHVDFSDCLYIGANLTGHTSKVISCTADRIGGVSDEAYAIGLNISGSGGLVEGNYFRNIYRQSGAPPSTAGEGAAVVINAAAGDCDVVRNRFENDQIEDKTIAIFTGRGGAHTVAQNTVRGFKVGINGGFPTGPLQAVENTLWMRSPKVGSVAISGNHGLAEGNLIVGYESAFVGTIPQQNNKIC